MREWRPTLGAIYGAGTTSFRVWAPEQTSVDLDVDTADPKEPETAGPKGPALPLTADSCGYWHGHFSLPPGTRYRYRLNGDEAQTYPDPASRYQPEGVHGPSQIVDHSTFRWTDRQWRPPSLDRIVFYELHTGTFTAEGTFRGVLERLPALRELGVTAIELMPIADFAGSRNWGYDGVALF